MTRKTFAEGLPQGSAPISTSAAIQLWQAEAHGNKDGATSIGIIASLYEGLLEYLSAVLKALRQQDPTLDCYQSLESSSATLFFWGADLGVQKGDLDVLLQHSSHVRDTALTLLISIGNFMHQGTSYSRLEKPILTVLTALIKALPAFTEQAASLHKPKIEALIERASVSLDDALEEECYPELSIEELCDTLDLKIGSLKLLNSSLEWPAEDCSDTEEEARKWNDHQDRSAHEYFTELIASRFPRADQELVESLGISNWNRFNFVQKQRKVAHNDPVTTVQDKSTRSRSTFQDSGFGSSETTIRPVQPAVSEYAATVISSRAEASHKRLPPLPREARSGQPFTCEVCERTVSITRTRDWKRHVFEDVCAYTCIFSHCSSVGVFFEDREAMTKHLAEKHALDTNAHDQLCPLCEEDISGTLDTISFHCSRHMEEIALGILPTRADSENSSGGSDSDPDPDDNPFMAPAGHSEPKATENTWPKPDIASSWDSSQLEELRALQARRDGIARQSLAQSESYVDMYEETTPVPILPNPSLPVSQDRPQGHVDDSNSHNTGQRLFGDIGKGALKSSPIRETVPKAVEPILPTTEEREYEQPDMSGSAIEQSQSKWAADLSSSLADDEEVRQKVKLIERDLTIEDVCRIALRPVQDNLDRMSDSEEIDLIEAELMAIGAFIHMHSRGNPAMHASLWQVQ